MPDPRIDEALRTMLPACGAALWLARDVHAADDLVQSAVERALSRWHTRRDEESLRSWLFAILYRLFLDGKRRATRYAALLGSLHDEEATWPSAERVTEANATLSAFAALPVEQRSLLLWVSVEGSVTRRWRTSSRYPSGRSCPACPAHAAPCASWAKAKRALLPCDC